MSLRVIIPTPLRRAADDLEAVEVEPGTIKEIIDSLDRRYPGFGSRVFDDNGGLRRFINIYVNGEDVRFLDNLATSVADGAEVSIVPAIAGG